MAVLFTESVEYLEKCTLEQLYDHRFHLSVGERGTQ